MKFEIRIKIVVCDRMKHGRFTLKSRHKRLLKSSP